MNVPVMSPAKQCETSSRSTFSLLPLGVHIHASSTDGSLSYKFGTNAGGNARAKFLKTLRPPLGHREEAWIFRQRDVRDPDPL